MKWLWRSLLLALILGGGIWLWLAFHPSPEKVIRSRLRQLAHQVSFSPGESDLVRLGKVSNLSGFFTEEVEVKIVFRDFSERRTFTPEMIQTLAAAEPLNLPNGVKIEFLDPNVAFAPGKDYATVETTMKATVPGDNDFNVQEMKFALRRQNEKWLVYRVETVRTLK